MCPHLRFALAGTLCPFFFFFFFPRLFPVTILVHGSGGGARAGLSELDDLKDCQRICRSIVELLS